MTRRQLQLLLGGILFALLNLTFTSCSSNDQDIRGVGMRLIGAAEQKDASLSGGKSESLVESPGSTAVIPESISPTTKESKGTTTTTSTIVELPTLPGPTVTTTTLVSDTPDKPFYVATAINEVLEVFKKQGDSDPTWLLSNPGPFEGNRVVLIKNFDDDWIEISMPIKNHGTLGWVKMKSVSVDEYKAKVIVDVYNETIEGWRNGELLFRERFMGGSEENPIPLGDFYINEIRNPSDENDLPKLAGTTAFSTTLESTSDGAPAIAILSREISEESGEVKTDGCIKVSEAALEHILALPLGTPVQIVG